MKKAGIIIVLMAIVAGVFAFMEFNAKEDLKKEADKYYKTFDNYRRNGHIMDSRADEAHRKASELSTQANRHNDNSTYGGIGAGGLLIIGGVLMMLGRRRKD